MVKPEENNRNNKIIVLNYLKNYASKTFSTLLMVKPEQIYNKLYWLTNL